MRLAQRAVVASIVVALLGVLSAPAIAGGSLVNVEPRSWARQGSTIRLSGTFCNGSQARVSAGPWFAYLDPPAAAPVLVGPVRVTPNTGTYCEWRLTATLRVPDVAPGTYWLQVCDLGCKRGVGDLIGAGNFTVISSLHPRVQAERLQALRAYLNGTLRESARQEELLSERDERLVRADAAIASAEKEITRLRDQLSSQQTTTTWFGASLAALIIVAALVSLLLWRRQHPRVFVPDTPAELIDKERVDA